MLAQRMDHLFMNHLDITAHVQDTTKMINNLNLITEHMETNVSDAMHELNQKLSLQLQVLGVKEDYLPDTFKDLLDRLDTTIDLVLLKIRVTSQESMEFTKTKFAELLATTSHVEHDLKETMLLNNLQWHVKMDNVLKQIKADIHSSSNIKKDDCAFGTSFEEGAGAGVNKVGSKTTRTYGGGTPAQSSTQWLEGA